MLRHLELAGAFLPIAALSSVPSQSSSLLTSVAFLFFRLFVFIYCLFNCYLCCLFFISSLRKFKKKSATAEITKMLHPFIYSFQLTSIYLREVTLKSEAIISGSFCGLKERNVQTIQEMMGGRIKARVTEPWWKE